MTSRPEPTGPRTPPPPPPSPGARRALVAGTGLIGGSIGLALREQGWHVSGLDLVPARAEAAHRMGALDHPGDDPAAELAVVATPVGAVAEVARALLDDPARRPDLVVTDVCGIKASVVQAVDHPRFVGGHPMAGSEQVGVAGADAGLFLGATWVLTPTDRTDADAFARLQGVVVSLGAEVAVLTPADHDRLVAVVSHVPHLVAATLMNAAAEGAEQDGALLRLAAGGFRDMTRVAAGDPGIWPDICTENSPAIGRALDRVLADLGALRRRVADHDRQAIRQLLERASAARRALPARATRPEHLAELRIPVPDATGVLGRTTSLAGDLGVNIYDIEIAHSAEGPSGVLVLVVDRDDAEVLRQTVVGAGFRCTIQELS